MSRSRWIISVVVAGALAIRFFNVAHALDKPAPDSNAGFSLSFLPKSFQRNPKLEFNVLTEMTPQGRKLPVPTEAAPTYYVMQVDKGEQRGLGQNDFSKKALRPEQIEAFVGNALKTHFYFPAPETGPRPTLVLIVHWGAYSSPAFNGEEMSDPDAANLQGATAEELLPLVLGSVAKRKAIIERASLVGGATFAQELNDALNKEAAQRRSADAADNARLAGADGGSPLGSSMSSILDHSGPFTLFLHRDSKTENLVEAVFSDSYYVVVSAIDYLSVAQKKPVLLWRTKLSLNSVGVSLQETISPLITAGANYFGRETAKPVVVPARIERGGHVEIGEPKAVEYLEPAEKTPVGTDVHQPALKK